MRARHPRVVAVSFVARQRLAASACRPRLLIRCVFHARGSSLLLYTKAELGFVIPAELRGLAAAQPDLKYFALRRIVGLVFLWGFWALAGRLPKARRGRVSNSAIHHHHHQFRVLKTDVAAKPGRRPGQLGDAPLGPATGLLARV